MLQCDADTEIYETIQGECEIYFSILPEIRPLYFESLARARQNHPEETTPT